MADRYWVGGTANWDTVVGTKWATTSGGSGGASVPTASDNVFFDANSGTGTCTIGSGNRTCKSIDFTGFTGTFAGSGGFSFSGSLTLYSGMTWTNTGTKTANSSVSGTYLITTAGKTLGALSIGGANTSIVYQLQDNLNLGGAVLRCTSGAFDTNGFNVTASELRMDLASSACSVDLSSGTHTFSSAANSVNITNSNASFDAGTSAITCSGAGGIFSGNNRTFYNVSFSGGGACLISGANTFNNLTVTGTASLTSEIYFSADQVINDTLTLSGNSTINRLFVHSSYTGTQRTLTAATVSASYADFEDIVGAGAGSWNLSAITGNSGDCGNNSGITFTSPSTHYWIGGTGSFTTTNEWASSSGGTAGTGRTPLPQDTARFDANSGSGTVTVDVARTGHIDCTSSSVLTINFSTITRCYGGITFVSNTTIGTGTSNLTFAGRGSNALTMAGKAWPTSKTIIVDCGSGTIQFADAFATGTSGGLTFLSGTLDVESDVTLGTSGSFIATSATGGTINAGSGTWTLPGTTNLWRLISAITFNEETSTLHCTNTSATAKTFDGADKTYYKVRFSGAASIGAVTITGSNTFSSEFKADALSYLKFTSGTTQTMSSASVWSVNGTASNLVTIASTSAGSAATISCASGTVTSDYVSLKDNTATGGATFNATNSTNVSGNTGWNFVSGGATGNPSYYNYYLGVNA